MKKIFGKKDKIRPASASDSTLKVPQSPYGFTRSSEKITTTHSRSSSFSTSTTITSSNASGTFPRNAYKPVYERTQEWSQKFDRSSPSRHSTSPAISFINNLQMTRKHSVPSASYQPPPTAYYRPPPSPLALKPSVGLTMQTDAIPYTPSRTRQHITALDLENLLKIKVIKCTRTQDHLTERIPTYRTNSRGRRGSLLVINNIKFGKHEKERKGAEKDVANIKELFRQMNFDTTVKTNLKKSEMESELKSYSKRNLMQYDVNVVVMMSHGCGDPKSGSTQICGTDGQNLFTSDVLEYFTNTKCPSLAGKPKIFIFQCCRGSQEFIYTDAKRTNNSEGDMLLAYATIPGFVSYREECIGSWYIQAICKVFMENAHDTHVEDMLKMVDGVLADKARQHDRGQISSFENRGFKCCYLQPL